MTGVGSRFLPPHSPHVPFRGGSREQRLGPKEATQKGQQSSGVALVS